MRIRTLLPILALAMGSVSVVADDDLDVTMQMVTDDDPLSDTVVRQIELPDAAADRAHEMAAPGLERAREASERGREASEAALERGSEARERGREARERGSEASERSRDARDSIGQDAGGR